MDHDLDELFRALLDPAAYPAGAGPVVHLETHISHVYLAGQFAYKLKKPVNFGFLDFSSRANRGRACEAELRLNRRLAPDWYLDVVPVCFDAGHYRIRPEGCKTGTTTERAVRMRRLPDGGLLDDRATRGQLPESLMDDIARQMAGFHARAGGPELARYGSIDAIRAPAIQNFEQTEPFVGRVFDAAQHRRVREATDAFITNHPARFEARQRSGRIVDGHGDLHLRNMCLVGHHVVIFDCIEFNAALRAGDAMGDIAFLTMDLEHRGLSAHRNRFLNEYLEQSGDYDGLPVLDFYQAYRACVRAKVSAFELEQNPALATEAQAYLELADRYFSSSTGGIVVTCGMSGSGKTTVAQQLARQAGAVVIRSDAARKRIAGLPLQARGDSSIYSPSMTERTYEALRNHARAVVRSGRWAILDAVHGKRRERDAAAALARELGVPFGIVYCDAPINELRDRLTRRAAAGPNVSDADVSVLERQSGFFEAPGPDEHPVLIWNGGDPPIDWLRGL